MSFTPSLKYPSDLNTLSSGSAYIAPPHSATTIETSYVPSITSLPDDASQTDVITVNTAENITDGESESDSESGSIMPRTPFPKGSSGGGGGKGGGRGSKGKSRETKKAERRKTKFGEAFTVRYNTQPTRARIDTLRPGAALAKRDEQEDPRRATLQELLDLLYEVLQFRQKGNDGHYDAMKSSLVTAITPEGTPLNDEDVYAVADAFDATVAWTEGEDESAASVSRLAVGSLIAGLAIAIGGSM